MHSSLVNNTDTTLFRELNDYLFQQKSLDVIIKVYVTNVKNGIYKDSEKIKNGKILYDVLRHELNQIRKTDADLIAIIVDYLFSTKNSEIVELTTFFENEFGSWVFCKKKIVSKGLCSTDFFGNWFFALQM